VLPALLPLPESPPPQQNNVNETVIPISERAIRFVVLFIAYSLTKKQNVIFFVELRIP